MGRWIAFAVGAVALLWVWDNRPAVGAGVPKKKKKKKGLASCLISPATENCQCGCTVPGYQACCGPAYTAYLAALASGKRVRLKCSNPCYGKVAVTTRSPYPTTAPIVTPVDLSTAVTGASGQTVNLQCAVAFLSKQQIAHANAAAAGVVECCGWPEWGSNSLNGSTWWEYEDGSMYFESGPHAGMATGAVSQRWGGSTSQAAAANKVKVSNASMWSAPW